MIDLIRSHSGYGDDFNFIKQNRTNKIVTHHSQGRVINLLASAYFSYSFDIIKENFINKNTEYFKAVYFDFAPLWAIPIYQERPVHSLKPILDYSQQYSLKECEALANRIDVRYTVHPNTKTSAILKSSFVGATEGVDETCITAYSYDIMKRVDVVSVYGGDGRFHDVSVPWDDYIPLVQTNNFFISTLDRAANQDIIARRSNLCIYK
jgi:hypothetical protein